MSSALKRPISSSSAKATGLDALFLQLAQAAHRDLGAGFQHDVAGLGVLPVRLGLGVAHPGRIQRRGPAAVLLTLEGDLGIEIAQDLFLGQAQRIEQGRRRQLAAAVDADMNDVLGVEFEIEPGTAIGNDAGREQQLARGMGLALVVIEEDARAAVHLGDDDALGAVDDEGAVLGHEGDVAHIDVLFLDVLDRLGAGFLVHIEHDEAQGHLERRGIGHGALLALLDVVFRILEMVIDIFEQRGFAEILDREDLAEHRFQPLVAAAAIRLHQLQELVIGSALNLDEVRHLRDLGDLAEILPQSFASGEGESHSSGSFTAGRRLFAFGWEPAIQNQWRKPPTPPMRESPKGGG